MNPCRNASLLCFTKQFCISILICFGCFALSKAQTSGTRPKPIVKDAAKPKVIVIGQPGKNVRIIDDKEPATTDSKPIIKYAVQTEPVHIGSDPNQPASGADKDITPPRPYFATIELNASHPKALDYAYVDFYSANIVSAITDRAEFIVSESDQSALLKLGGIGKQPKSSGVQLPGFLLHFKTKQNVKAEITINVESGISRFFYLFLDGGQTNYQSFFVSAADGQFSFIIQPDKDGYANLTLNSLNKGGWALKKVTIKRL